VAVFSAGDGVDSSGAAGAVKVGRGVFVAVGVGLWATAVPGIWRVTATMTSEETPSDFSAVNCRLTLAGSSGNSVRPSSGSSALRRF
jgi:hypothetical protein